MKKQGKKNKQIKAEKKQQELPEAFVEPQQKQDGKRKGGKKSKQVSKSKSKGGLKSKSKSNLTQQKNMLQKNQNNEEKLCSYQIKSLDEHKYSVKIHKNYQVQKISQIGKKIQNLVTLLIKKQSLKLSQFKNNKMLMNLHKISEFTYYPIFQFILSGQKPQDQKCSICQFQYQSQTIQEMQKQLLEHNETDLVMLKCSHIMHLECLKELSRDKQFIRCPVCFTIFGKMIGDQPEGTMTYNVNNSMHCDGYPQCGTITINYSMHAGKRGNINFPGTHRVAYLPDNKEGNEVLQLLLEAFNRKLIFTIGRSVTTGRDNQIVWNGIHHKTHTSGGSAYFGYPDPTYFQRVKQQLAAKGVY